MPPERPFPPTQPADKDARVRRVTWIGLLFNLGLSAIKLAAGIYGSSQAVVADAVHSLSDSTTDLAIIAGSHFWSKPADADHPYGHRRIETVVTIFIGLVLLVAGLGIAAEALSTIHIPHDCVPGPIAAVAAAVSIVCKEGLFRWTARVGKQVRSPALLANAWHHRLDAISSIPALLAVGGAILFPEWHFLDHAGALVVSVLIIHAAVGIVLPGISELIDAGASAETCERIREVARRHAGVQNVHGIRTRYISGGMLVELHIVVDGEMTVRDGHDIAEAVRGAVTADRGDVVDVLVHVDPAAAGSSEPVCP